MSDARQDDLQDDRRPPVLPLPTVASGLMAALLIVAALAAAVVGLCSMLRLSAPAGAREWRAPMGAGVGVFDVPTVDAQ
jgi:hypothetical protein